MSQDSEDTGHEERNSRIHSKSTEISKGRLTRRIERTDARIAQLTLQKTLIEARIANLQTRRANLVAERVIARTQAQIDAV